MRNHVRAFAFWWRSGAVVALCAGCIMLASCGGLARVAPSSATGQPTLSPTGTTSAGSLRVGDDQNGKTITLHPGQTMTLVLSSTAWTIQGSSDPQVLAQVGTAVASPAATCPYGGCGTVSATFRAVAAGMAHVSASRSSCGEAMGCTSAAGTYQITVVVTAASQ